MLTTRVGEKKHPIKGIGRQHNNDATMVASKARNFYLDRVV